MNLIQRLKTGVLTGSAAQTRALGAELAAHLPIDATLALHGDLGAGKTTFVQGIAEGLGVGSSVTSPTFTVYNLHRGTLIPKDPVPRPVNDPGASKKEILLMHLDAYRLTSPEQIDALLLDDFLQSPYCLTVEWPENIAGWIPADAWHFDLKVQGRRHSITLR